MSQWKDSVIKINENIYSTLSKQEKIWVGDKLDDVNIVYLMSNDFGFVCAKKDTTIDKVKSCYVVMAITKEKRHTNLSIQLIKNCLNWFINSDYEQMIWTADNDNIASNRFACKVGFTYGWKHANKDASVYIITNPNKIIQFLYNKTLISYSI